MKRPRLVMSASRRLSVLIGLGAAFVVAAVAALLYVEALAGATWSTLPASRTVLGLLVAVFMLGLGMLAVAVWAVRAGARREAEAQGRHQEEALHREGLLQNTPFPLGFAEFVDGRREIRVLAANDAAAMLFGRTRREEVEGELASVLATPAEVIARYAAAFDESRRTGGPVHVMRERPGVVYRATVSALPDEEGTPDRFVFATMDLTTEAQQRQALEAQKVLLEAQKAQVEEQQAWIMETQRAGQVGSWTVDPATQAVRFSDEMFRLLGLPASKDPSFEAVLAQLHPDDRDAARSLLNSLSPGQDAPLRDFRVCLPEDRVRYIEVAARASRRADGGMLVSGTARDVTDRREHEAAVADAQHRLYTLVQSMAGGVAVEDEHRRLVLVNESFCLKFGFVTPPAELVGVSNAVLMENGAGLMADPAGFLRRLQAVVDAGELVRNEEVLLADGRAYELDYVPLYVEGQRRGNLWHYRDVTLRKRQEDDLRAARDAAEAADRAKSAFLATMSHEIRTPMNGVVGMTEVLLQTGLTDEQKGMVEVVRDSSDALLLIINDILDFSKIESGHLRLERRAYSVRRVVESALDLVTHKATEKGLDLLYQIDDSVPAEVMGDETRLRQILLNLLSNATKFTDAGEVYLGVSTLPAEQGHVRLSFEVRDTGIGIGVDALPTLFDRFTQADASTTRRYGGTGLGLAISKRLTDLMGGTMAVQSAVGKGSTFQFQITAGTVASAPVTYRRPVDPRLEGSVVLIVDDNATNRRILQAQTERMGMRPYLSESADKALMLLEQGVHPDIIVLDLDMPDTDGVTLAREIRKRPDLRMVPLVLLASSRIQGGDLDMFAARLFKPVKVEQLHAALASALVGDRSAAELLSPVRPRRLLRVLVAEDNPVNQTVALSQLHQLGIKADVVGDGRAALDALTLAVARDQRYHLLLLDVQMPIMGGVECVQRLRQQVAAMQQPYVAALTAEALVGDRERLLAAGMDDYLSKPVYLETLAEVLDRAELHRQQQRSAA